MASEAPIPLSRDMIKVVQDWAADDRLWSTKETTEFNLYTFVRLILTLAGCNQASTEVSFTPAASPALENASSSGQGWRERAERAEAERDAYKRDLDLELDGRDALRRKFGARDDETFFAFIQRLAGQGHQDDGRQGEEQKNDQGAALLPADPSAAVQTETLPTEEEHAFYEENTRAFHAHFCYDCSRHFGEGRPVRPGWSGCSAPTCSRPEISTCDFHEKTRRSEREVGSGNQSSPEHSDTTSRSEAQEDGLLESQTIDQAKKDHEFTHFGLDDPRYYAGLCAVCGDFHVIAAVRRSGEPK